MFMEIPLRNLKPAFYFEIFKPIFCIFYIIINISLVNKNGNTELEILKRNSFLINFISISIKQFFDISIFFKGFSKCKHSIIIYKLSYNAWRNENHARLLEETYFSTNYARNHRVKNNRITSLFKTVFIINNIFPLNKVSEYLYSKFVSFKFAVAVWDCNKICLIYVWAYGNMSVFIS